MGIKEVEGMQEVYASTVENLVNGRRTVISFNYCQDEGRREHGSFSELLHDVCSQPSII